MAAAFIAASLADPVVESVSNSGVFGGHYADNNHVGVVPTFLIGLVFVIGFVATRVLDALRRSTNGSRDWLIDAAREIAGRSPFGDLSCVVRAQSPRVHQIGGRAPPLLQTTA